MRLRNFVMNLPCAECRAHASAYVSQNPPDLSSTDTFQVWGWQFHNHVNHRLGSVCIPFEAYRRLYANELCGAAQASRVSAGPAHPPASSLREGAPPRPAAGLRF